jgi:hypothetical protein
MEIFLKFNRNCRNDSQLFESTIFKREKHTNMRHKTSDKKNELEIVFKYTFSLVKL